MTTEQLATRDIVVPTTSAPKRVNAVIVGPLAVHLTVHTAYIAYTVTHVATGRAIGEPYPERERAIRAAQRMAANSVWGFTTLQEAEPLAMELRRSADSARVAA